MSTAIDVQICNSALIKLGIEPITEAAYTTPDDKASTLVGHQFSVMRELMLSQHPWNFCVKRGYLVRDATAPTYRYAYRYPLPATSLFVYRLEDNEATMWSSENGYILTDAGGTLDTDSGEYRLNITYNYLNTLSETYHAPFKEALAWALASDLSYALLQKPQVSGGLMEVAKTYLGRARSHDAKEGKFNGFSPDLFTSVRGQTNPDGMNQTHPGW